MGMKYRFSADDDKANEKVAESTIIHTGPETRTVQASKDDVDVNVIVRRFGIGEGPRQAPPYDPRFYGDFTVRPGSMREVLDLARDSAEKFAELPAHVREEFDNDESLFWYAVNDEKQHDRMVELGVLRRRPVPKEPEPPKPLDLSDETIAKIRREK